MGYTRRAMASWRQRCADHDRQRPSAYDHLVGEYTIASSIFSRVSRAGSTRIARRSARANDAPPAVSATPAAAGRSPTQGALTIASTAAAREQPVAGSRVWLTRRDDVVAPLGGERREHLRTGLLRRVAIHTAAKSWWFDEWFRSSPSSSCTKEFSAAAVREEGEWQGGRAPATAAAIYKQAEQQWH